MYRAAFLGVLTFHLAKQTSALRAQSGQHMITHFYFSFEFAQPYLQLQLVRSVSGRALAHDAQLASKRAASSTTLRDERRNMFGNDVLDRRNTRLVEQLTHY